MSTRLKPSVGFLRPEATFTHIAARQHFGDDNAEYVPMETESICRAVQHGEIDFGVLPIENLFEGSVGATLDAMYASSQRQWGWTGGMQATRSAALRWKLTDDGGKAPARQTCGPSGPV